MTDEGMVCGPSSGIHAARGSVRDGLAALQNFENLLRSPRIGPRSIGRIVGELRGSCAAIGNALDVLIDELALREPAADVVGQLSSHAREYMRQLDAALLRADRGDLGAKTRIALENDVHRLSAELGALRRLIDLLETATRARPTELEAAELVEASINAMASNGSAHGPGVGVLASLPLAPLAVITDPRAAMHLVELGVGWVAAAGVRFVCVTVSVSEGPLAVVHIGPGSGGAGMTMCTAAAMIAPSLEVARLAAQCLGASFTHQGTSCELCFPARTSGSLRSAPASS
ncbi:MAG: hypothetical protein HY898_23205 [Deltaproteobacteria bacterium]|nr:hypothetical protein [Deltaproteobacteria bacterium]